MGLDIGFVEKMNWNAPDRGPRFGTITWFTSRAFRMTSC